MTDNEWSLATPPHLHIDMDGWRVGIWIPVTGLTGPNAGRIFTGLTPILKAAATAIIELEQQKGP